MTRRGRDKKTRGTHDEICESHVKSRGEETACGGAEGACDSTLELGGLGLLFGIGLDLEEPGSKPELGGQEDLGASATVGGLDQERMGSKLVQHGERRECACGKLELEGHGKEEGLSSKHAPKGYDLGDCSW